MTGYSPVEQDIRAARGLPPDTGADEPRHDWPDRPGTDLLIAAARAWDALRSHAGAAEGSAESRQIAQDVMGTLCGADRLSAVTA